MEGTIGEVRLFGGNFAPRAWAFCEGQLLAISSNDALFSILGTMYGGDGRTTFALPDLRSRAMVGVGHGPGLSDYRIGQKGGAEDVTITVAQLPSHNHMVNAYDQPANKQQPGGHILSREAAGATAPYSDRSPNTTMRSTMIGNAGGYQSHNNLQPLIAIHYIICLYGIYPSRG